MWADIREPSLGSEFEIYEQGGVDLEWLSRSNFTVVVETRSMHISNVGI